jgi:2,3-diketo-5-methylthio-1-phosphopentane phosphatase
MRGLVFFCDFDGTIVTRDTCVELCERFADAKVWRALEDQWQERKIGSMEMARAVLATIDVPLSEILRHLEHEEVCAGFTDFARHCESNTFPLIILSDGYEAIIQRILARLGLSLPVYANSLIDNSVDGDVRITADFPHANPECTRCACCKKTIIARIMAAQVRPARSVLIGDGRSDLCAAGCVDQVYAKDRLAEYCAEEGIPFTLWKNFWDTYTT